MKISVIAAEKNICVQELIVAAEAQGVNLEVVDFANIEAARAHQGWGNVVLWRNSKMHKTLERTELFDFLRSKGIQVINPGTLTGPLLPDKYFQQQKIRQYVEEAHDRVLHYIPTALYASPDQITQEMLPLIEKPAIGSKGIGVRLITEVGQITATQGNIYQSFIPNKGDFRVICLGGRVVGAIRRLAKDGDFRNNLSQGGSGEVVKDTKVLRALSQIALRISSIFDVSLCGVDIVYHEKEKKYYFLEVNTLVWWQGFKEITGIDVAQEIVTFCRRLHERNVLPLHDAVKKYYDDRLPLLGDKRMHYASRMYLWTGEEKYREEFMLCKKTYIGEDREQIQATFVKIMSEKVTENPDRHEFAMRKKVLKRYPLLEQYNVMLFKTLFTFTLYEENVADLVFEYASLEEMKQYAEMLYQRPEDLGILSTLGLNFIYNFAYVCELAGKSHEFSEDAAALLNVAKDVYTTHKTLSKKPQLALYYYTHCIINATRFYYRPIEKDLSVYMEMLRQCEKIILEAYFTISLDNKLEYLVCCKMLGYDSILFSVVLSECEQSLANIGNFLQDRHNAYAKYFNKADMLNAEHRNVLFLMAFSSWYPKGSK